MVEQEQGMVRQIAWKEIFPWCILARCFRLSISVPVLLLMAVGILLTVLGWGIFAWLLSPDPAWRIGPGKEACPWMWILSPVPETLGSFWTERPTPVPTESVAHTERWKTTSPSEAVPTPTCGYLQPICTALTGSGELKDWIYLLLVGLWKLAVWAFFGAAVTRMAAVRLACDERVPLSKSIQFARQKWTSYVSAPLFPFLGMILVGVPIAILGLFLKFGFGILIAGLLWPLALLAGVMIMILLLGLVFGWPLMWTTISTEGTDCFDALSRSYAYVFQRPLRYLFYALVAAFLGMLGWLLVSQFAAGVIHLTYWSAGWGLGSDAAALVAQTDSGPVANIGKILIRFWVGCVKLGALSYLVAYFWIAAAAIYLLLRYDVDATEMDEVYLEEEEEQPGYGLPPLKTDTPAADSPTEPAGPAAAPNPQE